MGARVAYQKAIAVNKDLALFARNQDVFDLDENGDPIVNVPLGQQVAYDLDTMKSIDNTDIAGGGVRRFRYGIAVAYPGEVEPIRIEPIATVALQTASIKTLSLSAGHCGQPQIVDVYFGCIDCTKDNPSLTVSVIDDETEAQMPRNVGEPWVATVPPGVCACNTCDVSDTSKQVACYIKDHFTKRTGVDSLEGLGPSLRRYYEDLPFEVHLIYDLPGQIFCLSVESPETCSDCTHVLGVKSISVDGASAVPLGTLDASPNDEYTARTALKRLQAKINAQLGDNGSATVLGWGGNCCPAMILVSSCKTVVLNGYDDNPLTAIEVEDPKTSLAVQNACRGCDTTSTSISPIAGLRFIPKTPKLSTWDAKYNTKINITRRLSISLTGGFSDGAVYIHNLQDMLTPVNSGYELVTYQRQSYPGGPGTHYDEFNHWVGAYGALTPESRAEASVTVNPQKLYDVLNITGGTRFEAHTGYGPSLVSPQFHARLMFPVGTSNALAGALTFWNAVGALLGLPTVTLTAPVGYPTDCTSQAAMMGLQATNQVQTVTPDVSAESTVQAAAVEGDAAPKTVKKTK